jgi:TonB family protein
MQRRHSHLLLFSGVAFLCASPPLATIAQVPSPADRTPAELALLVNNMDVAAVETVRSAIGASDPMVRAVAARIAAVTAHPPFSYALAEALATEQHPIAAAEQARALLFIRGPLAADLVETKLSTSSLARVYAEWLANTQPDRLVDLLPKLATVLGDQRGHLNATVHLALDTHPEVTERLLRAWLHLSSADSWETFVGDLYRHARPGQDAVIIEALTTATPEIREVTVWSVVERVAKNWAVPQAVLDAIAPETAARNGAEVTAPTWEQFGREVIARQHRAARTPDRSAFLTAEASTHETAGIAVARLRQTLDTERAVLKKILGDRFPKGPSKTSEAESTRTGGAMRTVPSPWRGFMKELLATSKCNASQSALPAVLSVTYRPSGTVGQMKLSPRPLPSGCEPAFTALARLTLMDPTYPPTRSEGELLMLPFAREFIECADEASVSDTEPVSRIGGSARRGRITPPQKIRDFKPDYPPALLDRRVEGRVVAEGIISRTGCIANLEVINSVASGFDYAALRAITQWRFSPGLLDGKAVPVIMTVTVNFALR